MARAKLPISVLIITKNAQAHLAECLHALEAIDEVIVVDSHSTDATQEIVHQAGRRLEYFAWNGCYPKKKQWCLENIGAKHDWIFLLDADEIVTPELMDAMADMLRAPQYDAYFIDGQPIFCGTVLKHGRFNRKIALFKKGAVRFPSFADDPILVISEIEYHYQPHVRGRVGRLIPPLLHYCADSLEHWREKHERYAQWQAWFESKGINVAVTEKAWRRFLKRVFYRMPCRPFIAFADSFFANAGFFDGKAGYRFARERASYYARVAELKRVIANKSQGMSL